MTDNNKRLERIKERAQGMGLTCDVFDEAGHTVKIAIHHKAGGICFMFEAESRSLDAAESLLSVLDPKAPVMSAGLIIPYEEPPEGFEYVLALRRVPRG